jgi:hypothetical protein
MQERLLQVDDALDVVREQGLYDVVTVWREREMEVRAQVEP